MTKFNCKISDLEKLVDVVACKGKNLQGKEFQAITDCLINVKDNSLKVNAIDGIQKIFAISVDYKNIDVVTEGTLPIGDLLNFYKILSRFDNEDDVTVYNSETDNKIFIERESPKKIAKIPIVAVESISTHPAEPIETLKRTKDGYPILPKITLNMRLSMNADEIASVFKDGDVINERVIPWVVEDGKLKVSIGSEIFGSFENEFEPLMNMTEEVPKIDTKLFKTKTAFATGLDNIFSNIHGNVNIYLASDVTLTPLCVEAVCDKYSFLALLAPYVMRD